jgi:hypothetical protein
MKEKVLQTSLARIADFDEEPFDEEALPRARWEAGDYVLAEVVAEPHRARGALGRVELRSGRMTEVAEGDLVLGALGERFATLEACGSFRAVGADGRMTLLTGAGLMGKLTSQSFWLPPLVEVRYRSHVARRGRKVRMRDFVPEVVPVERWSVPTILVVGTSMSAGKTTAARVLVRRLAQRGLRVAAAKLTGAGRFRDVLTMGDAGADAIFDFVDVGLPSSIAPPAQYRTDLRKLLALVLDGGPDVLVAEAGASPLEPYNGDTVLAEIGDRVKATVLCASDPYAVVGVIQGFDLRPDLVAGVATSTAAGVELVEKLTGCAAVDVLDPASRPTLEALVERVVSR